MVGQQAPLVQREVPVRVLAPMMAEAEMKPKRLQEVDVGFGVGVRVEARRPIQEAERLLGLPNPPMLVLHRH